MLCFLPSCRKCEEINRFILKKNQLHFSLCSSLTPKQKELLLEFVEEDNEFEGTVEGYHPKSWFQLLFSN